MVSDVGWFSELPDDLAVKVAPDEHEVETLAAELERLLSDDMARERWAPPRTSSPATEHDFERVADLYAAALEEAAGGEAVQTPSRARWRRPRRTSASARTIPRRRSWRPASARPSLGIARPRPAWAWLAGIVVVSTLVRYVLGRGTVAPWIMVDELIYSELAKSLQTQALPRSAGARRRTASSTRR